MMRIMIFLTLVLSAAVARAGEQEGAAMPATEAQVQIAPVARAALTEAVTAYGEVIADPQASQSLNFPRPGQVIRVSVAEGQAVRAGQALVQFSTDPASAAAFDQAQAAVEFAHGELVRLQSLAAQHLATASQVAAARKGLVDAQAALDAARRLGEGRRMDTVRAPYDGVVENLQVKAGERLPAGAPLLVLARQGALLVRLGVEPGRAYRVKPGMLVHLAPVFGGPPVDARVSRVSGQLNPKTRLVDVLVPVAGAPGLLPGAPVTATIAVGKTEGWTVPRSAVLDAGGRAYLFQVAGGHARRVAVSKELETDRRVQVAGPLNPRLPVVVTGNYELKDGMAVRETGE